MKKTILISALAFAAAVFAGCSKENPNVSPANESGDVAGSKICAYIDKVKAHLDGVNMTWSDGDEMRIVGHDEWTKYFAGHAYVLDEDCAGKTKGTFTLKDGEDPATSANVKKFYGMISGSDFAFSGDHYLKYVFPTTQTYVENGIADGSMPLYTYGSSLDSMKVYYCGAIMSIQLYSKPDSDVSISKIIIQGDKDAGTTAGQHYVSCFDYPENPCYGKTTFNFEQTVTLNVGDGGVKISKNSSTPTVFNIVLPAKKYTTGLVITAYTTDGKEMLLSKSVFTAVPGTIYRMTPVEYTGSAKSHIELLIDGNTPINIEDVASLDGAKTVKVISNDGKVLTNKDQVNLDDLINTVSTKIALDISDIDLPDDVFSTQYKGCTKLSKLTLPKSIRSWSGGSLFNATLDTLVISEGITSTRDGLFTNFTGIAYIPASVTNIVAAHNSGSVKAYKVASDNPNYLSYDDVIFTKNGKTLQLYPGGKTADYTIPSTVNGGKFSVTATASNAFQEAAALETLTVPATITSMSQPFSSVKKLSKIILEGTETKLNSVTYNDSIFDGLFKIYNGTVICPADSRPSYINGTNGAGWKRLYELRNWTFDDGTSPM